MKKTIATVLGLCGFVISIYSQGQFNVDSSANAGNNSTPFATTGGLVWLDPDGNLANATLNTTEDINLELLWGVTASTVNQVLNLDPTGLNNPSSTSWLAIHGAARAKLTVDYGQILSLFPAKSL